MIYRDYREGRDFGFVKNKKPDPRFLQWPLSCFLTHFVQLYFTCEGCDRGEYMWVRVTGLAENENEELRGVLDNDPLFLPIKCGDVYEFSRGEIYGFQE